MDNSYFDFALNNRHEASQLIMAPPPPPPQASAIHQPGHATQGHVVDYIRRAVASSSDIHPDPIGYPWQPPDPLFPADPPSELGLTNPSGSSVQRTRSSIHPQKPPGRTTAIATDAWIKHKPTIRKLWMDEDRPLSETMAIMSQKHNFHASLDQYKKQISKWKWSKYIPAEAGSWMLKKIDERKNELGKDTQFQYRGQVWTEPSIRPRIERKKLGENFQGPPDAKTPSDIEYMTPRSLVHSPPESRTASIRTAQPTWTPPITSGQGQPMMRLIWNGRTKADYQAQHEEGLGDERSGRPDEAEAKFRSALEGLHHLLSTTHPETVTVAYRLASFFAKHVRMQDADAVLDWLTQAHLEEFGLDSSRTMDHIINVSNMFREWGRPEDATEFLQRAIYQLEEDRPGPNSARSPTTTASRPTAANAVTAKEQERASYFSIPSEGPINPSSLRTHVYQISRGNQAGEGTEAALLRLIKHCEQFPDKLIAHSLLCYPVLLDHYQNIDDVVKQSGALDQAERAIWDVLRLEHKRTKDDLIACVQLAKHLVKASRFESADDIFSQIECDAQDTFGSDHLTTIWFLEHIGTFYQNEGRWQDAAPRFEHALAARISRYGSRHESVRRLEDALENRHFESYVPSKGAEACSDGENERPINRMPAPSFIFVGRRAWQLDEAGPR